MDARIRELEFLKCDWAASDEFEQCYRDLIDDPAFWEDKEQGNRARELLHQQTRYMKQLADEAYLRELQENS
jgi:hypothetical protein